MTSCVTWQIWATVTKMRDFMSYNIYFNKIHCWTKHRISVWIALRSFRLTDFFRLTEFIDTSKISLSNNERSVNGTEGSLVLILIENHINFELLDANHFMYKRKWTFERFKTTTLNPFIAFSVDQSVLFFSDVRVNVLFRSSITVNITVIIENQRSFLPKPNLV